jgi:hypothetical protein
MKGNLARSPGCYCAVSLTLESTGGHLAPLPSGSPGGLIKFFEVLLKCTLTVTLLCLYFINSFTFCGNILCHSVVKHNFNDCDYIYIGSTGVLYLREQVIVGCGGTQM